MLFLAVIIIVLMTCMCCSVECIRRIQRTTSSQHGPIAGNVAMDRSKRKQLVVTYALATMSGVLVSWYSIVRGSGHLCAVLTGAIIQQLIIIGSTFNQSLHRPK